MPPTTDYTKTFDPKDKDANTLEKCVTSRTQKYTELYDYDLWDTFKDDFAEWTEAILNTMSRIPLINLRDTLRTKGVFVACEQSVVTALYNVISHQEQHTWTDTDITYHILRRGFFQSPNIEIMYGPMIRRLQATNPEASQQTAHFKQPDTPSPPIAATTGMTTRLRSQLNQARESTLSAPTAQQTYNPTNPGITIPYEPTVPPTTPGHQDINVTYAGQHTPSYGASIGHLRKTYSEDIKYGDSEDSFDLSYRIFIKLCNQMGLRTSDTQREAFFIMLKGEALRYYFNGIEEWTRLGIDPILAVKSNFENEEHLRYVQSQWDSTTLPNIMSKNPDKPIPECLEIMLRDLRKLYDKLRPELRNDINLHSKLVSATRLVPACHAATGKPSPTTTGLIQDLRSSVNQYEDSKQVVAQHPTDAYYTDRRYHGRQSRSPYRGRSPYGNRLPQDSRRHRASSQSRPPKRCFVCKKPGCWSTNHTEEERRKARQPYDRYIDNYITAHEGYLDDVRNDKAREDDDLEAFIAGIDAPSTYDTQGHDDKGLPIST